ncbi:hypothetical protein A8990_1387 [Paenibacillus taihuensis]|uniref:Bacterial Ig-like domain-containing protein n=1 Tax=Paenibacillus taihuensis TaxID=1156355 RepID=A0A3D9R1F9_9BACL|nr:immunoglobulin-like domain-containing protein [Paenibacillus taihuensis]REE68078.1 hypothetical protein A8990_1387 [Paenibacillus taihuensis]
MFHEQKIPVWCCDSSVCIGCRGIRDFRLQISFEVHEKTGFPQFSGKLLVKYGFYSHQDGSKELPAADLVLGINRLPEGIKTQIRLTELEPYPSLKPMQEISNETFDNPHGMRVNFPERRNAMYALRVDLLNAAGETVDGKVTVYAFAADEINARMEADRKTYKPSDSLNLKLTNWGPTSLSYGSAFGVQKWDSGEWKRLNGGQTFTMEIRGLNLGGENVEKIPLQWLSLDAGHYRIVRTFGGGAKSIMLAAPFEVSPK